VLRRGKLEVVRELRAACGVDGEDASLRSVKTLWPRFIVSNTTRQGQGQGVHWFTIAYSIHHTAPTPPREPASAHGVGGSSGATGDGADDEAERGGHEGGEASARGAKTKVAFDAEASPAKRPCS